MNYTFEDVLAASTVECTYPGLEAVRVEHWGAPAQDSAQAQAGGQAQAPAQAGAPEQTGAQAGAQDPSPAPAQDPSPVQAGGQVQAGVVACDAGPVAGAACESLFFPGCSFLNYALPLVQSVYELLEGAGEVDGMSLLCCGKILEYEGDGGAARASFERQLRERIAHTDVKRIVAACPNCVYALRKLLAADERTAGIQVVPLPRVLVDMGYRVDPATAAATVYNDQRIDPGTPITFCPKDSCPDRATGEFADALREIMADTSLVEPNYARKRSYCCGSRPRAAGHYDLGDKMARRHGDHARQAGANALVTACISCTFSIVGSGCEVPVFHYLELLFGWNIPWYLAEGYMKLRFLLEDADTARDVRGYKGIG